MLFHRCLALALVAVLDHGDQQCGGRLTPTFGLVRAQALSVKTYVCVVAAKTASLASLRSYFAKRDSGDRGQADRMAWAILPALSLGVGRRLPPGASCCPRVFAISKPIAVVDTSGMAIF